jgi:hypothetical protein
LHALQLTLLAAVAHNAAVGCRFAALAKMTQLQNVLNVMQANLA